MAYASIPTGAITLFNQAAAPVKWTRSTTYDDYTLRIVTGTPTTGGSNPFKTVNTNNVTFGGGTYSYTSITIGAVAAPVPNHTHSMTSTSPLAPVNHYYYANTAGNSTNAGASSAYAYMAGAAINQSGAAGSGGTHTHTYSASPAFGPFAAPSNSWSFNLAYIDNILATRTG